MYVKNELKYVNSVYEIHMKNYPIKMNRFVSLAVLIDNVKTVKPKGRKEKP